MKNLLNYTSWGLGLLESEDEKKILAQLPPPISAAQFAEEIRLYPQDVRKYSHLWERIRPGYKIHYFPFKSNNPILGCFFYDKDVCVNQKVPIPPLVKAFIALHESRHCQQYQDGIIEKGYFTTVVEGDKEDFLVNYRQLEEDANNFALDSLSEGGFENFVLQEGSRLKGNESMGPQIYHMMREDIKKTGATTFADLLAFQIL
jgi:hypothetical protein